MIIMDILNIVGFVIGVLGLAYALYQGTERKKLAEFTRSQAWYIYAKANNMTGIIQHAFQNYKAVHAASPNANILELLAKSDAFGQDLFQETIRQIQLSEPIFNATSIGNWHTEGKIGDSHKNLFLQLAIESKSRNIATKNPPTPNSSKSLE